MSLLYPRLKMATARSLAADYAGRQIEEIKGLSKTDHEHASFPATGGTRVQKEQLEKLRNDIISETTKLGESNRESRRLFDRICGRLLRDNMGINPGEAGKDEIWSFISCVLLPDCVAWRWPDRHHDRFTGGIRNTFQRLWWRAYVLYDDSSGDPYHLLNLPEDLYSSLMERTNLMADWRLTKKIALRAERLECDDNISRKFKENIHRDAIKRIRQKMALMNLLTVQEDELADMIDEQYLESIGRITP